MAHKYAKPRKKPGLGSRKKEGTPTNTPYAPKKHKITKYKKKLQEVRNSYVPPMHVRHKKQGYRYNGRYKNVYKDLIRPEVHKPLFSTGPNLSSNVNANKRLPGINYTELYLQKNNLNCKNLPRHPLCKKVATSHELMMICTSCYPLLNCCYDEILTA